jgi:hypothetical protein
MFDDFFAAPGNVMPRRSEASEAIIAVCEVCGNDYSKTFTVTLDGEGHTFDSFECAIHALAPQCEHCGCRLVGQGFEYDGNIIFYCEHCTRDTSHPHG